MVKLKRFTAGFPAAVCCLAACGVLSCGIFSPRDSEAPEVQGNLDPLHFKQIMAGTGEQFTNPQYEDFFDEGDIYEDINSGISSKDRLIQRLRYITSQQQYQNILVRWSNTPTGIFENSANDTLVLSGLTYSVRFSGNPDAVPDDSGSANIILAKNLEWRIVFWKDMPANNQKSFFSP
jgi:hypothetical protein